MTTPELSSRADKSDRPKNSTVFVCVPYISFVKSMRLSFLGKEARKYGWFSLVGFSVWENEYRLLRRMQLTTVVLEAKVSSRRSAHNPRKHK